MHRDLTATPRSDFDEAGERLPGAAQGSDAET